MTKKISELPAVVTPDDADEFEANQSGTSRKETRAQVRAGLVATEGAELVSAQANNDLTVNVKGWKGSQAEYDALTPTAGEVYYVVG